MKDKSLLPSIDSLEAKECHTTEKMLQTADCFYHCVSLVTDKETTGRTICIQAFHHAVTSQHRQPEIFI